MSVGGKSAVVAVVIVISWVPFLKDSPEKSHYYPVSLERQVATTECPSGTSWWPGFAVEFGGEQPPVPPAPFESTVIFTLGTCTSAP